MTATAFNREDLQDVRSKLSDKTHTQGAYLALHAVQCVPHLLFVALRVMSSLQDADKDRRSPRHVALQRDRGVCLLRLGGSFREAVKDQRSCPRVSKPPLTSGLAGKLMVKQQIPDSAQIRSAHEPTLARAF